MNSIERTAENKRVRAALASFEARLAQTIELIIAIQQIPSPTFAEAQRAAFIQERFAALDLQDVQQDALHNVYGRYPAGHHASTSPPVILSAHSDTVFPAGIDLSVRREAQCLYGPGVGDNATGVAGLLLVAQALREFGLQPAADLWFVANVGEEGLGDLRGMRAVVERFGGDAAYIIVEGGLYGQISHQAIGVRRYRIEVTGPGGHSWGSFGAPSAIHQLGHLIAAIDALPTPEKPKTTYNVGVIEGGTSINTIAHSASLLLDLRSEEPEALARLVEAVEEIVQQAGNSQESDDDDGLSIIMTQIGNRPAGQIPRHTPLVTWAEAALHYVGCRQVNYIASSTDANVPLSQGLTAVCVGLTESGNAHRLDEYIDLTHLLKGLEHLLLLALTAAGISDLEEGPREHFSFGAKRGK